MVVTKYSTISRPTTYQKEFTGRMLRAFFTYFISVMSSTWFLLQEPVNYQQCMKVIAI